MVSRGSLQWIVLGLCISGFAVFSRLFLLLGGGEEISPSDLWRIETIVGISAIGFGAIAGWSAWLLVWNQVSDERIRRWAVAAYFGLAFGLASWFAVALTPYPVPPAAIGMTAGAAMVLGALSMTAFLQAHTWRWILSGAAAATAAVVGTLLIGTLTNVLGSGNSMLVVGVTWVAVFATPVPAFFASVVAAMVGISSRLVENLFSRELLTRWLYTGVVFGGALAAAAPTLQAVAPWITPVSFGGGGAVSAAALSMLWRRRGDIALPRVAEEAHQWRMARIPAGEREEQDPTYLSRLIGTLTFRRGVYRSMVGAPEALGQSVATALVGPFVPAFVSSALIGLLVASQGGETLGPIFWIFPAGTGSILVFLGLGFWSIVLYAVLGGLGMKELRFQDVASAVGFSAVAWAIPLAIAFYFLLATGPGSQLGFLVGFALSTPWMLMMNVQAVSEMTETPLGRSTRIVAIGAAVVAVVGALFLIPYYMRVNA